LAARVLTPKPPLELTLAHIHAPTVSVKEQAGIVVDRLRRSKTMTFRALAADSPDTLTTVARFLSLLELFREGAVTFDQMSPLGELTVRWTGAEEGEVEIHDEFDGAPADETPEDQAPADEAPAEPEDRDDEDTQ
jgi:segregation and condensation protein A